MNTQLPAVLVIEDTTVFAPGAGVEPTRLVAWTGAAGSEVRAGRTAYLRVDVAQGVSIQLPQEPPAGVVERLQAELAAAVQAASVAQTARALAEHQRDEANAAHAALAASSDGKTLAALQVQLDAEKAARALAEHQRDQAQEALLQAEKAMAAAVDAAKAVAS